MSRLRSEKALLDPTAPVTLNDWRASFSQDEIKEFTQVSELIKTSCRCKPETWLILAVAKCDLYWSELDAAKRYYLPGSSDSTDSPFSSQLRELVNYLGTGNLRGVGVVPVGGCVDQDYLPHSMLESRKSDLGEAPSSALRRELIDMVVRFCAE
jgi:hypothetical protein